MFETAAGIVGMSKDFGPVVFLVVAGFVAIAVGIGAMIKIATNFTTTIMEERRAHENRMDLKDSEHRQERQRWFETHERDNDKINQSLIRLTDAIDRQRVFTRRDDQP